MFSYKTASFSDFQDLSFLITYVNPTDNQFQPNAMVPLKMVRNPAPVIKFAEAPPMAAFIMQIRAQKLGELEKQQAKTAPSSPQDLAEPLANMTAASAVQSETAQQPA